MRFEKGDKIEVEGRKYEVNDMDVIGKDDRVFQYDLDPIRHDIPARLKPHTDILVLIEYRNVSGDIEVIKDVEQ